MNEDFGKLSAKHVEGVIDEVQSHMNSLVSEYGIEWAQLVKLLAQAKATLVLLESIFEGKTSPEELPKRQEQVKDQMSLVISTLVGWRAQQLRDRFKNQKMDPQTLTKQVDELLELSLSALVEAEAQADKETRH